MIHNSPVYQRLTIRVNSSEDNSLILKLGQRISYKHLESIHNQAVIRDFKDQEVNMERVGFKYNYSNPMCCD
jgi:hypothetical protein